MLSAPFPKEVEKQLDKGGTLLTYIPVSEVIVRLNEVFGVAGWSYILVKSERDALDPEYIVAHVRLTAGESVKDGVGGTKIKRTKAGDILDLGDEHKTAVSDALKKAAQALGVGLYLARSTHTSTATTSTQQVRHSGNVTITEPANLATPAQIGKIRHLSAEKGVALPSGLQGMTKRAASNYIDQMINPRIDDQRIPGDDEEPF